MRYKWLNEENNSKLIVFFNGWGMDESIVNHLSFDGYDVLMFYDYNTLDTDFDFSFLEKYKEKHLVAWSMGVMIASIFDIKYTSSVAVNGTLKPIDNNFGIPVRIYDLTIRGFTPEGAKKFIRNMYETEPPKLDIKREFSNQKSELEILKTYTANQNFKYTKVIISDNDKIIPTKNQITFWEKEPNIRCGHAVFHLFKNWGELL